MSRRQVLLAIAFLAAAGLLFGAWSYRRVQAAAAGLTASTNRLDALHGQLASLAEAPEDIEQRAGDPLALARRSARAAGLPAAVLRGVQPRGERPLRGTGLVRRSVTVQLADVSPAQLGKWLAQWCQPQNPWRVQELKCVHRRGADNRFDIALTCHADSPDGAP